jgi:hypothetical protein
LSTLAVATSERPPSGSSLVAVANCVSGPRPLAGWIADMFKPFVPTLRQVAGFQRFVLRELLHARQYDFRIEPRTGPHELDWPILNRIAADYAGIEAHGARFVDVIMFEHESSSTACRIP